MKSVVSVNPFRCRVWELHERLEDHITAQTCKAEIQSFAEHGQLIPALGRPVKDDSDHDVEIVYGARRLFVARHLNLPLRVELRNLSDKEAILAIDMENRQRKGVSHFERGRSFDRWLGAGFFETQGEIAQLLRISQAQVSRLLKLARLPQAVVDAFQDPANIRESWGVQLATLLEHPLQASALLQRARDVLRYPRMRPLEIYRKLVGLAPESGGSGGAENVTRDRRGAPLFTVKHQRDAVAIVLPLTKVSAYDLERIKRAVASILQRPLNAPVERSIACSRYEPASISAAEAGANSSVKDFLPQVDVQETTHTHAGTCSNLGHRNRQPSRWPQER